MPKSKLQSGGKHRGKSHSYAAGGKVSDIPAFNSGGVTEAPKNNKPKPTSVSGGIAASVALHKDVSRAFDDKPDFKPASRLAPKPKKRDHPEEAGFSKEFVSAQERMRQPGDPTEKRLQSKIAEKDRKTSLSAARKAGHLYYWKNGTKMAAVTREDLAKFKKKQMGSKEYGKGKLRDFMNWHLKKTRRK
tara:strand:- start:317 stop:883 length:567 start_codon:yes stop_codon:yes gene_type:complete